LSGPTRGPRRALITGGAGFIGSNLADALIAEGIEVVVYDSFVTGHEQFVEGVAASPLGSVVRGDVLDGDALAGAMAGCDIVFHLAANADVRHGLEDPSRDLRQNTIATHGVLEAMRRNDIRRIVFSSTGSIYGEPEMHPTPEDCPFPVQTSLYGASKLAGEGLIQAYCEGYGFTGIITRFVSILGERYTHGHLFDFVERLRDDPSKLTVLGDGKQRKSYLYVGDCVRAVRLLVARHTEPGAFIYNLGTDEVSTVDRSVATVTRHLGITPEIELTGGARGWIGDSPFILLDCQKLRSLGWAPELTIDEAVGRTLGWFDANPWVFEGRA
jgi:UDP-glucose 4-epimerase